LDENQSYNGKTGADALVEFVKDGLRLLQETGIGAGTSKGYGEIEFSDLKLDNGNFEL
jgi:CRISPR/Cas system CSM-associated protein Csm3 (group 7 of RAMP superfamily)